MKKLIQILLFLFVFLVSAQRNEILKFKEISFVQKDSLTSIDDYKKSSLELFARMDSTFLPLLGAIADSFGAENSKMNEQRKKKIEDSIIQDISKEKIEKNVITFHYKKINDSIIERYDENNNTIGSIFINTRICREFYDFPYPPTDISFRFPFEKIKDLRIQEIRNQKKIIKGLRCFKIKCSYTQVTEHQKMEDFPELDLPDEFEDITLEMWVTEDIKSIYHPAFKVKEILEKYYPLEIQENNSLTKGMSRKIILKDIKY